MKTNGVEDILIGESYKSTKKNKISNFIAFIIIVLILGIACYIAYTNYIKIQTSSKSSFYDSLSSIKINNFVNDNVYNTMAKRFLTSDSEISSAITITGSNIDNSPVNNVELSNFSIDIDNKNDISEKKQYTNFDVRYLENDFFNFKYILDKEKINWMSNEIVSMYVEQNLDNLNSYYGIDYDKNIINNLVEMESNSLETDDVKNEFLSILTLARNSFVEDKYTTQSNKAIKKQDKTIDVESYTLSLTQEEFNSFAVSVLNELKSNDNFLKKLVVDEEVDNSKIESSENSNTIQLIEVEPVIQENNQEENNQEENNQEENNQEENNQEENNQEEINNEETRTIEEEYQAEEINSNISNVLNTENINIKSFEEKYIDNDLVNIVLGKKLNYNYDELQEELDKLIDQFSNMKGNGFKAIIYKSNDGVEKVSITLPNLNTIDIMFENEVADSENKLAITYLFKGNNSDLFDFTSKELEITADDSEALKEENINISNEINGYTFDIDTQFTNAFSKLVLKVDFIENNTINKKMTLDVNTEGGITSKKYNQNAIVTIMTSDNENKYVLDNNIEFKDVEIETLNDNTRFSLETLSDEDKALNIQAIKDRFKVVYEEKLDAINFINTNTYSNTLQEVSSNITSEEAYNALSNKITVMRKEAEENSQEFNLSNLEGLTIDGIKVTVNISDELATIVVDTYTFKVDKDFNITQI